MIGSLFIWLQRHARRVAALDSIEWSQDKKSVVRAALIPELTSSDEEGCELLDHEQQRKKFWKVKSLPWESDKLAKRKRQLDQHWLLHVATKKEVSSQLERIRGSVRSTRSKPDSNKVTFPAWAVEE